MWKAREKAEGGSSSSSVARRAKAERVPTSAPLRSSGLRKALPMEKAAHEARNGKYICCRQRALRIQNDEHRSALIAKVEFNGNELETLVGLNSSELERQ
eukprot:5681150-Pleurochrysis_carterae.AAC.1